MLVNSNEWFSAHNLFSNNLNPFLSFSIFINILSLLITFKSFNFNPNLLPQQKKKEENEIKVMISEIFHFDCFLKDFVKDFLGRIYCERFCVYCCWNGPHKYDRNVLIIVLFRNIIWIIFWLNYFIAGAVCLSRKIIFSLSNKIKIGKWKPYEGILQLTLKLNDKSNGFLFDSSVLGT